MSIEGITIENKTGIQIVFIEQFSRGLQNLIKKQLAGVFHGFAEVEDYPHYYSYRDTLKSFLSRYDKKSEETKKGMIGELLAHILINALADKLEVLSVYKNKEERSIKKGFDIIYFHKQTNDLWYTEVKAGKGENSKKSSDDYNQVLLKRSRDGILELFNSKRSELWQSAMIDVKMVVAKETTRRKMRDLLSKDDGAKKNSTKKRNVILVSVLYHKMKDKITIDEVYSYYSKLSAEKMFRGVVFFCIQKETFGKVANFLKSESTKQ